MVFPEPEYVYPLSKGEWVVVAIIGMPLAIAIGIVFVGLIIMLFAN